MLSPTSTASTTGLSNPRQIAAFSQIASAVMYTVPAGKKFVGYVHGNASSNTYSVTPSGGVAVSLVAFPVTGTSIGTTPMQLTFVAGTVITNTGANPTYVIGVESDL